MTASHPSPIAEGSFATYDLPTTSILLGGNNSELQDFTNRLVDKARAYGMEVSKEKIKVVANSSNNISADTSMDDQKLEETLCKEGTCSAKVQIRIVSAMAAVARLNRIWRCNTISFASIFKHYKSLVTAILLYGCETWTMLALKKGSRLSKPSA